MSELDKLPNERALDLSPYRWQNRILLIFAPSGKDERYLQQQINFSAPSAGFADRDLIVFTIVDDETAGSALTQSELSATRKRFNVTADEFAVLLIGKDGDVKKRYDVPVDSQTIFNVIDAMPMRQKEMQENIN